MSEYFIFKSKKTGYLLRIEIWRFLNNLVIMVPIRKEKNLMTYVLEFAELRI